MFQFVNPAASCFGCPGIGSPNCCVSSVGPNGCFTSFNPIGFGGLNNLCGPFVTPTNGFPQYSGNTNWCGVPTGNYLPTPIGFCPPAPFGGTWFNGTNGSIPGNFANPLSSWTNGVNGWNGSNWNAVGGPWSNVPSIGFLSNPFVSNPTFGGTVGGTISNPFCALGFGTNPGQFNSTPVGGVPSGSFGVPSPYGTSSASFNPFACSPYSSCIPGSGSFVNGGFNGAVGSGSPIGLHREAA